MSQLLEEILSRENMMLAYKKVKASKGAIVQKLTPIVEPHFSEYSYGRWMARKSVAFGDHYQAVAKTTGLHLINKEILAKRGLLRCLDYYLN